MLQSRKGKKPLREWVAVPLADPWRKAELRQMPAETIDNPNAAALIRKLWNDS